MVFAGCLLINFLLASNRIATWVLPGGFLFFVFTADVPIFVSANTQ